ncbi:Asp-tRNA(Asn)/Glu-tRNA(Gln) amidotransferase subunit GatC [Limibacter armeniacum]|uniref:Asp-tRNA(Asn)/Glu-tRNA(Gln) amidotransferase subunit GatC n=1 Tax=Limibacter armeniacum TaxID=466084 RepID=UPI002FE50324
MKIDKEAIEKIAHLSRLYFNEKDEERMVKSMNDIVNWVAKLEEVDTEGVEPLTHMTEVTNNWREDEVKAPLSRDKGLKNAPEKDEAYFRVPKVLE